MKADFVLDASVGMAWCFEDKASDYADTVLEQLVSRAALVPAIWPLEVGNVLVGAERRRRISEAESVRFLELLRQLPIEVENAEMGRMFGAILTLAREETLSTYDAAYLDLAMRVGLPLATQDSALQQAAATHGVQRFLSD